MFLFSDVWDLCKVTIKYWDMSQDGYKIVENDWFRDKYLPQAGWFPIMVLIASSLFSISAWSVAHKSIFGFLFATFAIIYFILLIINDLRVANVQYICHLFVTSCHPPALVPNHYWRKIKTCSETVCVFGTNGSRRWNKQFKALVPCRPLSFSSPKECLHLSQGWNQIMGGRWWQLMITICNLQRVDL